jgi:hypothetical protein
MRAAARHNKAEQQTQKIRAVAAAIAPFYLV